MGIEFTNGSLLEVGSWMELCFRGFKIPQKTKRKLSKSSDSSGSVPRQQPYKQLGRDVLAIHTKLRNDLWQVSTAPLALLFGEPSNKWHKANITSTHVIPFSDLKIYGGCASLRVECDIWGNITRLTLPLFHPTAIFYGNLSVEDTQLNDEIWDFVMACAGIKTYIFEYFEYLRSIKTEQRRAHNVVDWGQTGVDLVTFAKVSRKQELKTKQLLDISDFSEYIMAVMNTKGIKVAALPGRSLILRLSAELVR
jgi:hypothetical protein